MAVDTCAADGLCALACPVAIDTGALVKRLRREAHSPGPRRSPWAWPRHLARCEPLVRLGLRSGRLAQAPVRGRGPWPPLTRRSGPRPAGHPHGSAGCPGPPGPLPATRAEGAPAIYFPACISRMMGHLPGRTRGASACRRCWCPWPSAPGCRCTSPGCPGRLLRRAVLLQGLRRGPPARGERRGGAVLGLERRRAGCRWCWTPAPAPTACRPAGPTSPRRTRPGSTGSPSWTPWPSPTTCCCRGSPIRRRWARGPAPGLLHHQDGPHRQAPGHRRGLRRAGGDPPGRRLLRLRRGPRLPLPRTHRRRHPPGGGRGEGGRLRRPLLQLAAPARSGSPGRRGASTGASCTCWRATR